MIEPRHGIPPSGEVANGTLWAVVKELAAISRAQARLTKRLCDLIEKLPPAGMESVAQAEASTVDRGVVAEERAADTTVQPGEGTPIGEIPPMFTELDEVVIEIDHRVTGNGGGPVVIPPIPVTVPSEASLASPANAPLADERARTADSSESPDAGADGPDEVEESGAENEMVLTLESGDACVGVLWDQVVQIGSLSTSTVPDRITIDRDEVGIVSLGNLLHGVSREEKYFVILAQDGERAGVACERMLGLGPIAGKEKREKEPRIQVLKVPFLLTFASSPRRAEKQDLPRTTQTPEEQDKQGPLRALVAVRYLPARVGICRHVRGRGWQVGEAAGLEAATVSLDLGRWDALFLEARANGEADEVESTLLRRVLERKVPVIRVGSRISGYPVHEGPVLMFPFTEAELDAILVQIGRRDAET
jgi:hypothetical protein